jgi:acyl-CoA synthetase (AMP-forming)/AMP-acid ligase II
MERIDRDPATSDLVPAELRAEWRDQGVVPEVDLFTMFRRHVEAAPGKAAVIDDGGSTTYSELLGQANRVAGWLGSVGVGRGDVVAVQLPNLAAACAADLAIAAVGAICVPFPVLYRHNEVRSLLQRTGAVAFLCARRTRDFDHAEMAVDLQPELPSLRFVAVLGEAHPAWASLDAVLEGPDPGLPGASVSPTDPLRIIVSSGTEAAPKTMLYSHDSIAGIANLLLRLRLDRDSRMVLLPPLSTGFGALGTFGAVARCGSTLVVSGSFDPTGTFKLMERERATHLFAVPTMLSMMVAAGSGEADLSTLRVVASFGAAITESKVHEVVETFGCRFVNGYGCTDGAICLTGWDDPPERIATTVGRPNGMLSLIRVLGPDDTDLPAGQEGEICARGPMSPLRYFNSPDLDEKYRFDGGWVHTGDLGVLDDGGYLRITGRKKDIIVRGGYNISPAEIEAAIVKHPSVVNAAVIGYPDERLGERICACVTVRDGEPAPTLPELVGLCVRDGLAKIKHPERLEVLDELPLNPTGKILKRVLRERIN